MNSNAKISRRVLLSTLAAIPTVVGPLRPATVLAQANTDPLPSWNNGAVKASITNFVVARHDIRQPRLRRDIPAHCHL